MFYSFFTILGSHHGNCTVYLDSIATIENNEPLLSIKISKNSGK